jgi:hypothetical protein
MLENAVISNICGAYKIQFEDLLYSTYIGIMIFLIGKYNGGLSESVAQKGHRKPVMATCISIDISQYRLLFGFFPLHTDCVPFELLDSAALL